MARLCIDAIPLRGQRVLIRVDFDVPLEADGAILDDERIRASLPTVRYAVEQGARVVLVSHLGRPKGTRDPGLSLAPVARRLEGLLGRPVGFVPDCVGAEVEARARALGEGDALLLENCRYHKEDEANNEGFARQLAALADIFVNDAFGAAHRAHASTLGVAKLAPLAACGFLMRRELEHLGRLLGRPARPFLAIIGGAKVADKLAVVENLIPRADALIVGGAMAFTFLRAQGLSVGASPVEAPLVPDARRVLDTARRAGIPCVLPADHVIAEAAEADAPRRVAETAKIPPGWIGFDIGPGARRTFAAAIAGARSVFWNGPMSKVECAPFAEGTRAVAAAVADLEGTTVIGGGDTLGAVRPLHALFDGRRRLARVPRGARAARGRGAARGGAVRSEGRPHPPCAA